MKAFSAFIAKSLMRLRFAFWRLVYWSYSSRYRVNRAFRFNGVGIILYGEGDIELGADSYISEFTSIHACAGHTVRVGRRCRIANNVRIYTQTTDPDADFRVSEGTPVQGDVEIADGVWVGVNVYIGPGITVGADSVIGANSVVTKDVPPGEIWGGVPARLIRLKAGRAERKP